MPAALDAALAQRKLLRHKDGVRARRAACRPEPRRTRAEPARLSLLPRGS